MPPHLIWSQWMGEYAAGAADVLLNLDATNNKIDKCYMYKTEYIRTRQMSLHLQSCVCIDSIYTMLVYDQIKPTQSCISGRSR